MGDYQPPRSALSSDLVTELRSKLSAEASLILSTDETFEDVTLRWSKLYEPDFAAAVLVATEEDIQATVRMATAHNVPFLVSTGKHGNKAGVTRIRSGIHIDMRRMNKVDISEDGTYATVGGGVILKDIISGLIAAGKVTSTGGGETVGIGLYLGGGHGILQGKFGLAADQILEVRLVLADGRLITVSATSEPDLFWGLRGAGQNFGIVTEMKIKIYDSKPFETWTHETYIYSGDHLEEVFEKLNQMSKREDSTAQYFGIIQKIPEVDPHKPVIIVLAYSAGDNTTSTTHSFTTPLHSIPHISLTTSTFPYTGFSALFGCEIGGPNAIKGRTVYHTHPIYIPKFSIPTMRAVYEAFGAAVTAAPALVLKSNILLEGYPMHGVQAIDPATTAFPWRADSLLCAAFVNYEPDEAVHSIAYKLTRDVRDLLYKGTEREELHSYVSYAGAEEGDALETFYGYEPWRMEKLRALKGKWDPEGRFGFCAGIV